jgi:transcription antitermination protein NusB
MTRRSRAREVALQLLFQFDLNPVVERAVQERFIRERLRDGEAERFCLALVEGIQANRAEIDRTLSEVAENWRLPRMAAVDRNVLRLGVYELLHMPDTPATAVINEAIELARRFGSKDSPSFVNGLLDRIARQRAGDAPPAPPAEGA